MRGQDSEASSPHHPGLLHGLVAIVTGAAKGIGRCIAEFLARDGAAVMLADLQATKAAEVARWMTTDMGWKADAVHVDIAKPESARDMAGATVRRFGRIDVLVNNAAIDAPQGRAWELDDEHWTQTIDVDLSGAWWCTKAVIPLMIAQQGGRIIFITSVAARRVSSGTSVAYNAAKAGLIGLTVGLAVQLEGHGIRVNAITQGQPERANR